MFWYVFHRHEPVSTSCLTGLANSSAAVAAEFFEEPVQGTWSTSDLLSLEWMVLGISRHLIDSQISAVFGSLPLGINLSWPTGLTGARDVSTSQIISLHYHWIVTGLVTCVPGIFEISTSEYYPLPTSSRYWETSTIDFQRFPVKNAPWGRQLAPSTGPRTRRLLNGRTMFCKVFYNVL